MTTEELKARYAEVAKAAFTRRNNWALQLKQDEYEARNDIDNKRDEEGWIVQTQSAWLLSKAVKKQQIEMIHGWMEERRLRAVARASRVEEARVALEKEEEELARLDAEIGRSERGHGFELRGSE